MPTYRWFIPGSQEEPNQPERRRAVQQVFRALKENATLRDEMLASPQRAYEVFRDAGDIDIPPNVRVVCVTDDIESRDTLVVLRLPTSSSSWPTRESEAVARWTAEWPPYTPEELTRGRASGTGSTQG